MRVVGCSGARTVRSCRPNSGATTLKDGRVVLNKNILNGVRDTLGSANFAALRQVASDKDTVRVSTSESGFLRFDFGTPKLMADAYNRVAITWAIPLRQTNLNWR